MDLVDDRVPPIGRRLIPRPARRLLKPELEAEPDEPDDESNHEAPEGPELVASEGYFLGLVISSNSCINSLK